jgi:hypothetical protein
VLVFLRGKPVNLEGANMNDIIVWDNGDETDNNGRYTLLIGKKGFIFGNDILEDPKNITEVTKEEIIIKNMGKSMSVDKLPKNLIASIKQAIRKKA